MALSISQRRVSGLTARAYFTRKHDMMHQLRALATYCEERWATKIGQGLGFCIRIGPQEQLKPNGRRLGRLNADNRRQAAHRRTGLVDSANIKQRGGRREERPPRGTAVDKATLCSAPAHEEGGAAATGAAALSCT